MLRYGESETETAFRHIIAVGANLPTADGSPPLATCRRAAAALAGLPGLSLVGLSRWYATAPVPASDQPDYINGAVLLEGPAHPAGLLTALAGIERAFGRERGEANAARVLDLDIIAMDGLLREAPDPVLPHPRMHSRAFVLAPVAEIAPGLWHPRLGRTVLELLAAVDRGGVRVL